MAAERELYGGVISKRPVIFCGVFFAFVGGEVSAHKKETAPTLGAAVCLMNANVRRKRSTHGRHARVLETADSPSAGAVRRARVPRPPLRN